MCSIRKHIQRSHCTYKRRMAAARWYCNYNMTKAEREQMRLYWQMMMNGGAKAVAAESENK